MATRSIVGVKLVGLNVVAHRSNEVEQERWNDFTLEILLPGLPLDIIRANSGDTLAFYTHWDGYPSWMGEMLKQKLATSIIKEALLGDGSSLNRFVSVEELRSYGVECIHEHSFDKPCRLVSAKYHRDGGEDGLPNAPRLYQNINSAKDLWDAEKTRHPDVEYVYLVRIRGQKHMASVIEAYSVVEGFTLKFKHNNELGWIQIKE